MKELLTKMVTSAQGGISSKIIIGSVTYTLLILTIVVYAFTKGLEGMETLFIGALTTSAALIGLTTVENIRSNGSDSESNL